MEEYIGFHINRINKNCKTCGRMGHYDIHYLLRHAKLYFSLYANRDKEFCIECRNPTDGLYERDY